ncbi:hypothetical protein LR48_Vigan197s000100 [Vigna angularis]|uniref:Uncharacterized protein n=1 Tax=Phaseolus angularis TaxID=3914 RepID=A0A0L9T5H4_PHAAN|nr:hypothetical protein LR48_Vigan197s000100 [Vigna angularis]
MEKPQLPLSDSLPLSGTQELTGDLLRGKMAAEGRKLLTHSPLSGEFGERSEEGERWNQKRHQKVKMEKPQLPLSDSLPLSGTQELTGDLLRGKMAAEGRKLLTHSPLSGTLPLSGTIFGLGPNFL